MKGSFRFEEDLAMISLMHHEYFNGKGYPRGLSGNQINLYSKIVSVAHAVEKMMKPMRISATKSKSNNKSAFSMLVEKSDSMKKKDVYLYDAVKEIMNGSNTKYDPTISKIFVSMFTIYPIGSIVLLNDKRKGLVFAVNPNLPIRPVIKIVSNENGDFIKDGETINLLETNQFFITGIVKDNNFLQEVQANLLDTEEEK